MRCLSMAFAAVLLSASTAQAGVPAKSTAAYQVSIAQFKFQPAHLTVPAGARVTWANRDEEPHTVTSVGGQFKSSAALDSGDTFSMVFTRPGTYTYFCSVHPFMTATIVVE